jgi:hypothetical protein
MSHLYSSASIKDIIVFCKGSSNSPAKGSPELEIESLHSSDGFLLSLIEMRLGSSWARIDESLIVHKIIEIFASLQKVSATPSAAE